MSDNALAERAPGSWVAPLVSTLVTFPACGVAYLVGGFSAMACDSCGEGEADAFESSFGVAFPVLLGGLGIALVLLFVSWALPWERRYLARRAVFALSAPLMVPFAYVVFAALVDWP
ncbi:hypothetical protein EJC51_29045 [Streptomyces aquilus]|uniref:Uncharacterized protein n=1 Tax=Streptomyces aquilus TaxID=2548456 RepID=A0A3S9I5Z1_9ACTN|nr:hypothetical protein [Streptomyces aquilus]AZP19760.1 hypothetical protein EJC51_29045 [Streptomyces aquilus]